ncbi:MAG: hypothetical protein CVU31_00395 [Betaproteobacteria bacterium HGW-Betaproteobacteria-4]|jgi:sugar lactone lactonase YvrE|nr:MAG: hypothetical protein CVU31_00395 [Betaproteobacteria bacterium HGW-Betaproteobacteria-4]
MNKINTLVTGLNLAEGPRPDGKGNIYFTDVFGRGLYRYNADGSFDTLGPKRLSPGGCVMHRDGRVIYSARDGLALLDPATGDITPITAALDGKPILDINDIEADPEGNLWGGTIDHDALQSGKPVSPGMIFRLSGDGTARQMDVSTIANGMEFSRDGKVLYFSDTGEGVFAYDVGQDGTLSHRRLVVGPLADSDGIVLDVAGGIWVARYLGNTLVRYTANGMVDAIVETPFACVTSAAFGGDDLRTLYITGGSLSETGTGGLISLRVDVPGHPPHRANIPL